MANVSFADFVLIELYGFLPDGVRGSHHFFKHATRPLRLNLQPRGSEAKGYQIKQFLATIEENGLELNDDDD